MNRPLPNLWFSVVAFVGAVAVAVASGVKGRWAVAVVFGALAIGFFVRALEFRHRGPDGRGQG